MEPIVRRFMEHRRDVSTVVVTERGIYKADSVPADVQTQLEIDVVHTVYVTDSAGHLLVIDFDIPEAMDENDEISGGYSINGTVIRPATGPSSVIVEAESRMSSILPPALKGKADFVTEVQQARVLNNLDPVPLPIISHG